MKKTNGWPQFGQMHPKNWNCFTSSLDHSDARASPYELEHNGEVIKATESNVTEPHTNMNSIQLNNAFFASFFKHPFSFFLFLIKHLHIDYFSLFFDNFETHLHLHTSTFTTKKRRRRRNKNLFKNKRKKNPEKRT